jgi:hypothetical protein
MFQRSPWGIDDRSKELSVEGERPLVTPFRHWRDHLLAAFSRSAPRIQLTLADRCRPQLHWTRTELPVHRFADLWIAYVPYSD